MPPIPFPACKRLRRRHRPMTSRSTKAMADGTPRPSRPIMLVGQRLRPDPGHSKQLQPLGRSRPASTPSMHTFMAKGVISDHNNRTRFSPPGSVFDDHRADLAFEHADLVHLDRQRHGRVASARAGIPMARQDGACTSTSSRRKSTTSYRPRRRGRRVTSPASLWAMNEQLGRLRAVPRRKVLRCRRQYMIHEVGWGEYPGLRARPRRTPPSSRKSRPRAPTRSR